ncbi:MAG: PCRF domain-containing protein, partial [Acidobacteriota bacterium]
MPNCGGFFDPDTKRQELAKLETQIAAPEFWNDQEKAQKTLQQRARLERMIATAENQARLVDDIEVLFEFAAEDDASANELRESLSRLTTTVEESET